MRLFAFLGAILVLFALANTAAAQVRYSVASARAAPSGAQAAGLRLLTWPGKTAPAAPKPLAAPVSPRAYAPMQPPLNPYGPPAPALPPAAALPTSIYAPPPPPAAPQAAQPAASPAPASLLRGLAQADVAGANGELGSSPRFYSLHRAYGDTPDPIPLPQQFFPAPSDLAQPPPPPARPQMTANGHIVRPAPADPDAGGPTSN